MKKIVRLTESELVRLVNKIIKEQNENPTGAILSPFREGDILSASNGMQATVTKVTETVVKTTDSKGKNYDIQQVPNTNKFKILNVMGSNAIVEIQSVQRGSNRMIMLPNGSLKGMGLKM